MALIVQVLKRAKAWPGINRVSFSYGQTATVVVSMSKREWEAMGSPDVLTVGVAPGDCVADWAGETRRQARRVLGNADGGNL